MKYWRAHNMKLATKGVSVRMYLSKRNQKDPAIRKASEEKNPSSLMMKLLGGFGMVNMAVLAEHIGTRAEKIVEIRLKQMQQPQV